MLTLTIMQQLWPHGDQHVPGLIEGTIKTAPAVFAKYGLDSDLVVAHAMAQFDWECMKGLEMVENVNYSPSRAQQVFGRAHPRASEMASQGPVIFASYVYGGRMGNAPLPSHDGYNFRGRGFSQTTGKEGYQKLATKTGFDLINHPELLSDPDHALECGVADFIICGCLPFAKQDNLVMVTRRLNGGLNGLAGRRSALAQWKRALKV